MIDPSFIYRAKVVRVIDGDTIIVDFDLGLNSWRLDERLRLNRINAPEIRGRQKLLGKRSMDWLVDKIEREFVVIETIKDKRGKFGRYLAEVWIGGVNVNDEMVELGLAEYKDY